MLPDLGLISGTSSSGTTVLTRKKLVFEIGEGDKKKVFEVIEPSAKKRDEYIDLVTSLGKQFAERQLAAFLLNKKIEDFSSVIHTDEEWINFRKEIEKETKRIEKLPTPDTRPQIEFFLGKLEDSFWEDELTPSIREKIITKCEEELCNLGEIRKNLENLLPQTTSQQNLTKRQTV